MKPGWEASTLGDVLEVLRNGVNCKQDKSGTGDKISRIESISDAQFNSEKIGYATLADHERERYRLKTGDILFSHINSAIHVGKTAIFDIAEPIYHGVNLLLMRPKAIVTPAYLDHALKFLFQSGYWLGVCKQSVNQASVNQQDISKVRISYPTLLSEQKRIVAILDEAFDGIATAKANAEKNLQNANRLFASYLQSAFGQNEEQVELSQVATDISDGDHSPPPKSTSGVPFITISNIDKASRRINFGDTFTVSAEYFAKLKPNRKPKRGDVLYTVTGSFGIPVLVDHDNEFCFQRHIGLVRPNASTDSRWLNYALLSPHVFAQANTRATGTAQKTVSLSVLRSILVPKVALKTQRIVAAKLAELEVETQRLESRYQQKLAALAELKKSLLHKAFSDRL